MGVQGVILALYIIADIILIGGGVTAFVIIRSGNCHNKGE